MTAHREAEAKHGKLSKELTAAQRALDHKRAELLAAVEKELAPFVERVNEASRAPGLGYPPHLDRFPWAYSASSTDELAHKALYDVNGHHGTSLREAIVNRRTLPLGDMALAILEQDRYAPERPNSLTHDESRVQEAFEAFWSVWSSANREAIAALSASL